ncbi:MAG: hypothetical protein DVB23_003368 [Verrucomicrobia bacterium]|nr:MAG: hypothetical protein DVB23_003368 [Verrucomicrobiota bacterium]
MPISEHLPAARHGKTALSGHEKGRPIAARNPVHLSPTLLIWPSTLLLLYTYLSLLGFVSLRFYSPIRHFLRPQNGHLSEEKVESAKN